MTGVMFELSGQVSLNWLCFERKHPSGTWLEIHHSPPAPINKDLPLQHGTLKASLCCVCMYYLKAESVQSFYKGHF